MYENLAMSTLKWHQEKIYSVYKKYMAVPAGVFVYQHQNPQLKLEGAGMKEDTVTVLNAP